MSCAYSPGIGDPPLAVKGALRALLVPGVRVLESRVLVALQLHVAVAEQEAVNGVAVEHGAWHQESRQLHQQ